MFARLTALLQREDDVTDKFNFELTAEPTSLFKDGMMRKPDKALLRNTLLDKVDPVSNIQANACVIDGSALLHKVKWEAKGIGDKYINFLRRRYGCYDTISVVCDSYKDKTSIKTQEHVRRYKTMSGSITVKEHMNVSEIFFRNTSNKEQLLKLLSTFLRTNCFGVVQCKGVQIPP